MTTTNTYEVYFKIALYPEDINGFHYEEEFNEESEITGEYIVDFNKYLCSKEQSTTVLKYLKNEYDVLNVADVCIFDLEFSNNGKFNCKIKIVTEKYYELNDDEIQEIIEDSIWPSFNMETVYILINETVFKMVLNLDYFVEGDDDGDDEKGERYSSDEDDKNEKIYPDYISSDESEKEIEEEDI
jgi:hypothetical protein